MAVLPALRPLLDAVAAAPSPDPARSVADRRAESDAMTAQVFLGRAGSAPALADERTYDVAMADGTPIRVRVYRPTVDEARPAYVYFHGGGWWLGNIDLYDDACRRMAVEVGCTVAAVGYRLAPEHRFPTAAEDCFAALGWVAAQGATIGVDPTRLAVGGGSAGGNLAAVVALMARDRGGPALAAQVLDIPATDLTMQSPSITQNATGYMLTKAGIEECRGFYAPDPADWTHPYASPLLAPDLSGLPPAVITTCEFDPLRDEGEQYGMRLVAAGVPVLLQRALGHIHGSLGMGIDPDAGVYRSRIEAFLRDRLGTR